MFSVKSFKVVLTLFILLYVLCMTGVAGAAGFKVFINNSPVDTGSSVTIPEGGAVIFEIRKTSDLPIELDLTGHGDLVHTLLGKKARFETTYAPGNYNPKIVIGDKTKNFMLSVKKSDSSSLQIIPQIAWPLVSLLLFICLFFFGGLKDLLKRFSPVALQIGNIRIEASELISSIDKEIYMAVQTMDLFFSRDISSRFLPSSLYHQISYYVHVFEFLNKIGITLENSPAWNTVGTFYFNSDPEKAQQAYERAIALAPDDPTGYANMGMLYRIKKADLNSAKNNFIKALEISQTSNLPCPIAYMGLASVYRALGDENEVENYCKLAMDEFKRNVARDKSDYWSYFGLGWCQQYTKINLDLNGAVASNKAALNLKHDFYAARYNLSCNLARKNDTEASVKVLRELLTPVREILESFGFKTDEDFELISSDKKFKDFCETVGIEYAPLKS